MRTLPVLLAAVFAILPAPAGARIVIGASIHGLRPGDAESRFTAILGRPDGPRDFGDEPADYGLDFRSARYHGVFRSANHRATLIATTSHRERTRSGVGPGVSAGLARARLHGERCLSVFDFDRNLEVTDCVVPTAGAPTDVYLFDHQVIEVDIEARD